MNRKRLFLDTEFTELSQQAQLISLGMVTVSGDSFYAEFTDYDPNSLSKWHLTNVIAHLTLTDKPNNYLEIDKQNYWVRGNRKFISQQLSSFLPPLGPLECWLDYAAYDWVLFCDLFGGSMHLPNNLYYIPFDLMTLLKLKGIDPDISREEFVQDKFNITELPKRHHALGDAQLLKLCIESLLPSSLIVE